MPHSFIHSKLLIVIRISKVDCQKPYNIAHKSCELILLYFCHAFKALVPIEIVCKREIRKKTT